MGNEEVIFQWINVDERLIDETLPKLMLHKSGLWSRKLGAPGGERENILLEETAHGRGIEAASLGTQGPQALGLRRCSWKR